MGSSVHACSLASSLHQCFPWQDSSVPRRDLLQRWTLPEGCLSESLCLTLEPEQGSLVRLQVEVQHYPCPPPFPWPRVRPSPALYAPSSPYVSASPCPLCRWTQQG